MYSPSCGDGHRNPEVLLPSWNTLDLDLYYAEQEASEKEEQRKARERP